MTSREPISVEDFESLIAEHHTSLRAFIRTLGAHPDWVDDIAQEAFLVAFRRFAEYDQGEDFGAWLRGIARWVLRGELKKKARRHRILSGSFTDYVLRCGTDRTDPRPAVGSDLLAAMEQCVGKLPARHQDLLSARYSRNLSIEDIAENLGATGEAVRQSLMRVRRALRDCIEMNSGVTA